MHIFLKYLDLNGGFLAQFRLSEQPCNNLKTCEKNEKKNSDHKMIKTMREVGKQTQNLPGFFVKKSGIKLIYRFDQTTKRYLNKIPKKKGKCNFLLILMVYHNGNMQWP